MSDLAIAAVTATLRGLLFKQVQADVTTLPPDRAASGGETNRLNLFLYQVSPNAAWRNQPIPTKVKPGETGREPLAVTLHYLLTAYGDNQDGETDHRLLGTAMRVLHDNAVLSPGVIRNSLESSSLAAAQLDRQYEPVRVTMSSLSPDEMSKLWTTFQTNYRMSTAYQASVVLLESKQPFATPLPVAKRGEQDQGADVTAELPAELQRIEYRDLRTREPAQSAAELGMTITLVGARLPGARSEVVILNPERQRDPADPNSNVVARITPEADSSDSRMYIPLDASAGSWVSGPLHLVLEAELDGKTRRSKPIPFAFAPQIHDGTSIAAIPVNQGANRKLIVHCEPPVAKQSEGRLPNVTYRLPDVSLLLSSMDTHESPQPIPAEPLADNASTLPTESDIEFNITNVPPGRYRVRLRIGIIDTSVMRRDGNQLEFDDRLILVL